MGFKRIRTKTSGAAGGVSPTTGNVEWGPSFGQSAGDDQSTWDAAVAVDFSNVGLTSDKSVGVAVDLTTLALDNSKSVGVAADLADIALDNTKNVGVAADLTTLALDNEKSVGVALDVTNLALDNTKSVGVALAGSVVSAPFWQSVATSRGSDGELSSITCNKPSGLAVGDLMLAFVGINDITTAANINTPSGWTLIRTDTQTNLEARSFWKIADSSDVAASNFTFTFSAAQDNHTCEIHRIQGAHATTPIDANSGASLADSALDPDPSAPAVTTVANNCLVFAFLFHDHLLLNQTHTPPASHVERTDFEDDNSITGVVSSTSATRVFATPGSQAAVEFNCTESVATDAVMQRISIAPGTISLPS